MKGIIIAAGSCNRLRPLTDNKPKCMLQLNGKTLLQTMLDLFKANSVTDVGIIVGHAKDKITYAGLTKYENKSYLKNSILHSLMFAREHLEKAEKNNEDIVISYSDILINNEVLVKLIQSTDAIAAVVDTDWKGVYEGRTDHPISEAENAVLDDTGKIVRIGKNVIISDTPKNKQGEFIGLWKFTPDGIRTFLSHFDKINKSLNMDDSFQNSREWQKSYITDIFQEMIDRGEVIRGVLIRGGWNEFDTVQDFIKLNGEMDQSIKGV